MNKIHILVSLLVGAASGVSATFLIMNNDEKEVDLKIAENGIAKSEEVFVSTVDIYSGWENVILSKKIDEWHNDVGLFDDYLIQEIIQLMAHQKIIANEKESSIMITPKRIDTLLRMVEENEDVYEHGDKYLDILKRWRQGDFAMVDVDHNVMMQVQNNNSLNGRAEGIATKEQEIHYIAQVFGKSVDKVFNSNTLKEYEKEESIATEDKDLSWVDDAQADMLDAWKSGDKTFDERLIEEVMLKMAHQQAEVHVEDGSIEITSKRIKNLKQIIEEDKNFLFHYESYLGILKRWEKGDFTKIHDDLVLLHSICDGKE
ncbi:DUF6241 domain-containing protein [Solibacillus sp. FSL K6-4121]|uniref:DUF6241 domain-containing protein n=1 Tax=Solibacillus sp. FSL K6-4121 TaxID=2921505 RepID=UPI0030FA992A